MKSPSARQSLTVPTLAATIDRMSHKLILSLGMLALVVAASRAQESAKPPSPQAVQFFESKVRPVLVEHCYRCHGDIKKPKAGLRLDSRAAMLVGGDQGPVLVPGQPE